MGILHDLGIEPGPLVFNLCSFLVLVWLMTRLLFKPVSAFLEQRKQKIAEDLDKAQDARTAAEAELAAVRERRAAMLAAVEGEAEQARQAAAAEAEAVKAAARTAARETELAARSATEREQRAAATELQGEAAGTAAAMARRILQTSLTEERHRALLDQFISDVERLAAEQPA